MQFYLEESQVDHFSSKLLPLIAQHTQTLTHSNSTHRLPGISPTYGANIPVLFSLPMSPPCQECLSSHDLVILACLIICFVVSRHVSDVRSCPLSLVQWFAMNMVKISPSGQQCHHQYELETNHNAIVAFIYLKPTLIWKWITSSTKCHFNCSFILPFLVDSEVIVKVCHFFLKSSPRLYLVSCIFDSCLSLELMIIQDVLHGLEGARNVSHPLPPQWKLHHLRAPHCVLTVLFSAPWTLPPWSFCLLTSSIIIFHPLHVPVLSVALLSFPSISLSPSLCRPRKNSAPTDSLI